MGKAFRGFICIHSCLLLVEMNEVVFRGTGKCSEETSQSRKSLKMIYRFTALQIDEKNGTFLTFQKVARFLHYFRHETFQILINREMKNVSHSNSLNRLAFKFRHTFCSSKMLLARFSKIWLRLYSNTLFSNSCAFCIPVESLKADWLSGHRGKPQN